MPFKKTFLNIEDTLIGRDFNLHVQKNAPCQQLSYFNSAQTSRYTIHVYTLR